MAAGASLNKTGKWLIFELMHAATQILAEVKIMKYGRATFRFITLRARTKVGNRRVMT